jgi:hypothetical protein
LCESDDVTCTESQALHHLAAQGLEFALKSYLRAQGVAPDELTSRIGHSMLAAFEEALARGLPTPPAHVVRTIQEIAPHLRDDQFRYIVTEYEDMPDLTPLLAAGLWVLAQGAELAATDYYVYFRPGSRGEVDAMVARLRADLLLTAAKVQYPH